MGEGGITRTGSQDSSHIPPQDPKEGAGSGLTIRIPLPSIKPPVIEDDFLKNAGSDISALFSNITTIPLGLSSAAAGSALGANDFANAMGTTVGSGALPFSLAKIFAGFSVWYGAAFGGKETAGTVKKGIWDIEKTTLDSVEAQTALTYVLAGATAWIMYATARGWPVSTSQSTVGALLGVGSVAEAIKTEDPAKIGDGVNYSAVGRISQSWVTSPIAGGMVANLIYLAIHPLYELTQFSPRWQFMWRGLQILTGMSVAYSIGRNDLANFVGPLAGGLDAAKNGMGNSISSEASVSQFLRMLGGVAILAGVFNFSKNVTSTIGSSILELNYAKAISAEMSTALVVDYFSNLGIPISTSHTIMGSVIGLAVFTSPGSVPYKFIGSIGRAWLISIPASALLAGGAYALFSGVSSVDRSAPSKDVDGAAADELIGETVMRADRVLKDLPKGTVAGLGKGPLHYMASFGRGSPIGLIGGYYIANAVMKLSKEGMSEPMAEVAKTGVEIIPVAGGVAQMADGIYALFDGSSWWTNTSVGTGEAWADVGMGALWTVADLFGIGVLGRLFKGTAKAVKAADRTAKTLEEAEKLVAAVDGVRGGKEAVRLTGAAASTVEEAAKMAGLERSLHTAVISAQKILDESFRLADRIPAWFKLIAAQLRHSSVKANLAEVTRGLLERFKVLAIKNAQKASVENFGKVGGRLISPGSTAMIERASSRALKSLLVKRHYKEIMNIVSGEFPLAADAVRAAMDRVMETALKGGNPKHLTHAARKALAQSDIPSGLAKGVLKAAEKRVPVGVMNLATSEAREYFKEALAAAVKAVHDRYSSTWRRFFRMAATVATEPLTFRITIGLATDGMKFFLRPLSSLKEPLSRIFRGWVDTANPFRFLKIISGRQ